MKFKGLFLVATLLTLQATALKGGVIKLLTTPTIGCNSCPVPVKKQIVSASTNRVKFGYKEIIPAHPNDCPEREKYFLKAQMSKYLLAAYDDIYYYRSTHYEEYYEEHVDEDDGSITLTNYDGVATYVRIDYMGDDDFSCTEELQSNGYWEDYSETNCHDLCYLNYSDEMAYREGVTNITYWKNIEGYDWDEGVMTNSYILTNEYTTSMLISKTLTDIGGVNYPTNQSGELLYGTMSESNLVAYSWLTEKEKKCTMLKNKCEFSFYAETNVSYLFSYKLLATADWGSGTAPNCTTSTEVLFISESKEIIHGKGTNVFRYPEFLPSTYPTHPKSKVSFYVFDVEAKVLNGSCNSCSGTGGFCPGPGFPSFALLSVDFALTLGEGPNGSPGFLQIKTNAMGADLATPATLEFFGLESDFTVVRDGGGVIQEVQGGQALAKVSTIDSYSYEVSFYARTNGVYLTNDPPYAKYTIKNPDASPTVYNRFQINETRGASTSTNEYVWDDSEESWSLSLGSDSYKVGLKETWNTAGDTKTESRTVLEPGTTNILYKVERVYSHAGAGFNLVSETLDPDGFPRTTSYTYYPDGNLKQTVRPDGSWTINQYDSSGRILKVFSAFKDQAPTTTESLCRVTEYSYTPISGSGDDGSFQPDQARTVISKLLGSEISRTYYVYKTFERKNIRCQTAGAAWNAANNLVTTTYLNDDGDFIFQPEKVEHPDGTLTLYSYQFDANTNKVTTVSSGEPNGGGTAIVDGTKTVTTESPEEVTLLVETYDIASNVLVAQETFSNFDVFGRPGRIDYLDGTFVTKTYGCCGVDSETDREGITTSYTYDEMKRPVTVSRSGITQITYYDDAGMAFKTSRLGWDSSEIIQSISVFDGAGELAFQTNAVGSVTSFSVSTNGSGNLVRTTTLPSGGTLIQTYYKDGSLASQTGTATHGSRTEYGVENDGSGTTSVYTKEIKLLANGNDSGEWVKSYTDLMGRPYLTKYSDSSTSRQYYNSLGQLWKQEDPDGIVRLFQYNDRGEREYTAVDMDQDDTIDFAGSDRITRTVTSAASAGATLTSHAVRISKSYVWDTDSVDNALLVSTVERAVTTNLTAQVRFGLTSMSYETCGTSCITTNEAPDGTYTVTSRTNGFLHQVIHYDSGDTVLGQTTYAYDPHGRQTSASALNHLSGSTVTATTYDNADRPVTMTVAVGDSLAQSTTNHYDVSGQVWKIGYPDGTSLTNEYHLTGELKKTSGSRAYPVEYTYDSMSLN